jgi:hypothetical protein
VGRTESRPTIGHCRECGREGRIEARGLDRSCYDRIQHAGQLENHPRRQRTQAEFVEDYKIVSARFADTNRRRTEQIARALGYSNASSLHKIVSRARRAGYEI